MLALNYFTYQHKQEVKHTNHVSLISSKGSKEPVWAYVLWTNKSFLTTTVPDNSIS